MSQYVYFFANGSADGNAKMKPLLGGKGANLAEMTNLKIPVPPGFTISTEACADFFASGERWPAGLKEQSGAALVRLQEVTGKTFGRGANPLLVSVRSGAAESMPGMMDTVLNLGLNPQTLAAIAEATQNPRFAWDSYRRFIAMFGDVVLGIPKDCFEQAIAAAKQRRSIEDDTELAVEDLQALVEEFRGIVREQTGAAFPDDPAVQLERAIDAVFRSWNNPRAIAYRQANHITGLLGTAVNVQTMVFGNLGEDSGTGVAFTRNPATGEDAFFIDFLANAQGEDVVAGTRTPMHGEGLRATFPRVADTLDGLRGVLEAHYRDMQDIEFTIERGKFYVLQTRSGKRTAFAALKIAVDLVDHGPHRPARAFCEANGLPVALSDVGVVAPEEAVRRLVPPASLPQLLAPIFDAAELESARRERQIATGIKAGPGAASGPIVFTSAAAIEHARAHPNQPAVLVRPMTEPDDFAGMVASAGVLTSEGGPTSHAAVVARQMGIPCLVGCRAAVIDVTAQTLTVGEHTLKAGDVLSLDGFTGEVYAGPVATRPSEILQVLVERTLAPQASPLYQQYERFLSWADEARKPFGVRANADTPEQAAEAIAFGAAGIGLCRTEHMFAGDDRIRAMQEMILAADESAQRTALAKVKPFQVADFVGIFRVMAGRPVTVRLLDPPLHEFLPHDARGQAAVAEAIGVEPEAVRARVEQLAESNPMLGHRGCRLGITHPLIYEMQVEAIVEAACQVAQEGTPVAPEIMVPLVGFARELDLTRQRIERAVTRIIEAAGVGGAVTVHIGTMIEVPRGALTADEVAEHAEFFSFGTNDLTQMTLGFSRDDTGKFIDRYLARDELSGVQILNADPFATLEQTGVGALMELAVERGRRVRPELKIGICGEHGGDPESVRFCHGLGLDYVSCAPRRVPVARLAAAQAALAARTRL